MTAENTNPFISKMKELNQLTSRNIDESFGSTEFSRLARNHGFLVDIQRWIVALESREENPVLIKAAREAEESVYMASCGMYRHAFFNLRSALEMAFALIGFSANSLNYRLWLKGTRDITWHSLIDPDSGILSDQFISAYCPLLQSSRIKYQLMAIRLYRICSEFVHNNFSTHDLSGSEFNFKVDNLEKWNDLFETYRLLFTYVMFMRFYDELSPDQKIILEDPILEEIGYIAGIRSHMEA